MNDPSWLEALNASPRLWASGLGEGSVLKSRKAKLLAELKTRIEIENQLNVERAARARDTLELRHAEFIAKWESIHQERFILLLFSLIRKRARCMEDFSVKAIQLAELCVQKVWAKEELWLLDPKGARERADELFLAGLPPICACVSRVDKSEFYRHVSTVLNILEASELESSQVSIRFNNQSLILTDERAVDLWKQSENK
jgi:hypothetical protein